MANNAQCNPFAITLSCSHHGLRPLRSFLLLFLTFLAFEGKAQSGTDGSSDSWIITPGRGYSNLSFSLDQRKAENEDQLLRQVVDQDKVNFRITASGGYALKDGFTVGLGLSYGRDREDITFLNEDSEEVTSRSIGQDISFIPNIRKYIPFGDGKFQVFVQSDLRISLGESERRNFLVSDVERIENNYVQLRLGVQPGAVIFFNRNWAFETSVGIVGLSSKWSKETVNNDRANQTRITENNIDLKLNLLALNLGVAYYF
ncbi:hypothetical protein [Robiginitalea sediminis]|uniref:hypothetical protein n=1 Tax=Robiginitalea sediminis TaxID=1982593 RepID=UPI000B4AF067|nr:hypothetical protein [Robiginitalea sediminis]